MSQRKKKKKMQQQNAADLNKKEKSAERDIGRTPDGRFAKGHSFSDKYKDEYADRLIDFFSQPLTRIEYKKTYYKGELSSETPIEITNDFPTLGMFAREIGVSLSTLQAWAGIKEEGKYKHDQFATAYACVKEWAGGMMESGALSGKLDSNMAKFVLTNDYGKQDKQVIENNIKGLDEKDMELIRRVEARLNGNKEE